MSKAASCILHISDWNMEDRYYRLPISVLREFISKIKEEIKSQKSEKSSRKKADTVPGMDKSWDWFVSQVRYPSIKTTYKNPVRLLTRLNVEDINDNFFLDYLNPEECIQEIEQELKEEAKET